MTPNWADLDSYLHSVNQWGETYGALVIRAMILLVIVLVVVRLSGRLLGKLLTNVGLPERRVAFVITGLLFVMILSGGLVAGTHAGLAYNNWPLMGQSFFPPGLYATQPFWIAALEDIGTIQFNHRMLAYLLSGLIFVFAWKALRAGAAGGLRIGIMLMVGLLVLQVSLGISTLLYLVPVPLAAAHQGVAICLFTSALYVSHRMAHTAVVNQRRYGITAVS